MHHLRQVLGFAMKIEFEIRFHLVEEFTPGTCVKRGTFRQSGLNRLGQEVAFEYAYMLDPRAMLGNNRIASIPRLESVLAEVDKFQFQEGEMFSPQRAQFPLNGG